LCTISFHAFCTLKLSQWLNSIKFLRQAVTSDGSVTINPLMWLLAWESFIEFSWVPNFYCHSLVHVTLFQGSGTPCEDNGWQKSRQVNQQWDWKMSALSLENIFHGRV
jgi:hypothetical protein